MPVPPVVAKHVEYGASRGVFRRTTIAPAGATRSLWPMTGTRRAVVGRWDGDRMPLSRGAVASAMSVLDEDHRCFMVCGRDMHAKATVRG